MSWLLGMIETRTCWISSYGLHQLLLLLLVGDHGYQSASGAYINSAEYLSIIQNENDILSERCTDFRQTIKC